MIEDPTQRIGRPRQIYTRGAAARLRPDDVSDLTFRARDSGGRGVRSNPGPLYLALAG